MTATVLKPRGTLLGGYIPLLGYPPGGVKRTLFWGYPFGPTPKRDPIGKPAGMDFPTLLFYILHLWANAVAR